MKTQKALKTKVLTKVIANVKHHPVEDILTDKQ